MLCRRGFGLFFLFMGIMGISQMLINSTLEEKSNRVYEVLLSSVSSMELMAGKIQRLAAPTLRLMGVGLDVTAAVGIGPAIGAGVGEGGVFGLLVDLVVLSVVVVVVVVVP